MKSIRLLLLAAMVLLSGCAALNPSFDQPTVTVKSFRLDTLHSGSPQFLIDLHVVNPNGMALRLNGLAYSATIDGHKVLAGASSELPEIAAYGEGDLSLTATPDMLGGLRLVTDIMQRQRGEFHYLLSVKLDVAGMMTPLYIKEEGAIGIVSSQK